MHGNDLVKNLITEALQPFDERLTRLEEKAGLKKPESKDAAAQSSAAAEKDSKEKK